METNPYEYDTPVQWSSQQNQLYEGRYASARTGQMQAVGVEKQKPQPKSGNQKPKQPERMSKARALALADKLKKGIIIASFASFVTFSGLIANHQVSTTASQTSQSSSGSSQATSTSTSKNSNGFFKQQGGSNFGSSSSSQGSSNSSQSSSSGTSSASQTPVSGTHTS